MKEIGLISDNHGYVGDDVLKHLKGCDEVWHAGDIGSQKSITPILSMAPVRGVYGNIDTEEIRAVYPLDQLFEYEGIKVFMTHIGGYPGRYKSRVKEILTKEKPNLYICGHSHILKVMPDKKLDLLHMNPGAYGHHGFHVMRTILKFNIQNGKISNLRVVELGRRGRLS